MILRRQNIICYTRRNIILLLCVNNDHIIIVHNNIYIVEKNCRQNCVARDVES